MCTKNLLFLLVSTGLFHELIFGAFHFRICTLLLLSKGLEYILILQSRVVVVVVVFLKQVHTFILVQTARTFATAEWHNY